VSALLEGTLQMQVNEKSNIQETRATYSRNRLGELRQRIAALPEVAAFPTLSIFGAGSYARLEASEYSDIDMFFLVQGKKEDLTEPRTNSMRLFGKIVEIIDDMHFPKFSNDGEYLTLLSTDDILENLGGRIDDHNNYFTARMLLLLESHCLFGDEAYMDITAKIVNSYFRDFPDHDTTFQPVFLLSDISRYWKTLVLNYENRRNFTAADEAHKTRHRVRNFKLKFSRMTTCYASIAAIGSLVAPVADQQIVELTTRTPQERLKQVASNAPSAARVIGDIQDEYGWFLEMTGLPTLELEDHFADRAKRKHMFERANAYGHLMFNLLRAVDEAVPEARLLRYLVI
jgi:hypothetical protein